MSPLDPGELKSLVYDARWTAVTKVDLDPAAIGTWDDSLARDQRLLVPIDVQALFVAPDGVEPMVRLPSALSDPGGQGAAFPEPFTAGTARPPGVHLHWAAPDALLRGELGATTDSNRLALPALPDRWVVLRLVTPAGATTVSVAGWVLEADRAVRVALADWPAASATTTPSGAPLAPAALTGAAGGAPTWAATYDSVENRFALHDPLDDIALVAPNGVIGNSATYVVAGWWSDVTLDPLDAAHDGGSLDALLHSLGWSAVTPWVDTPAYQRASDEVSRLRSAANLTSASRFATAAGVEPPAAPPIVDQPVTALTTQVRSQLTEQAAATFVTTPWWPHATLLHGSVYGVPVGALDPSLVVDQRPGADQVRVALGSHDDDVLGALASSAFPAADDEARGATEGLLGAFTGQLLRQLGSPDGAAAVEEHEHDVAFGSLPGGVSGDDRFVAGASNAPRTIGRAARSAATAAGETAVQGASSFARAQAEVRLSTLFLDKRALITTSQVDAVVSASSGVGEPSIDTEPRIVERPAPRFHFPLDPMVAVQGGGRSLRHGNDGRTSPDGLLWCRWAHQTVRGLKGLLDGGQVLPSLGNGAIPTEVLAIAQEAAVHSPYNRAWLAGVAAASSSTKVTPALAARRLDAEVGLRFGTNAVYDGATQALSAQASSRNERMDIADQLLRHSLYAGVEPSPVGVTAWSQPWVPLWLEWEAELTLTDSMAGWQLDTVDLEPDDAGVGPVPVTTTHRGRTLLTTGAARTLEAAVRDFLKAEDALEVATGGQGEVPDDVEAALSTLADAVAHLDTVTTTLDGLRQRLLGLPPTDGFLRTTAADGTLVPPAPIGPPQLLAAGSVRVTMARLLDAFGRTLDLPAVVTAAVPVRNELADAPAALRLRPRLPRPARWMFRLVDAGGGPDAAEARVDQVDPGGMVNPVAGFLLPDHLDESLELFDVAGNPVGELSHEPIGGRVVWDIAPGRTGPPDAGPQFGLSGGQLPLGWFATGLVGADVKDRNGPAPAPESALSATLRAIDTTLWSVDAFAGLGSEHIAGLVGRPIAVVRAHLWLELQPEDLVDLSDPDRADERRAAETALAAQAFPVRLGELTRTDDGLLGFLVDDDYEHLHLVDRVVAGMAKPLGPTGHLDDADPIDHPYLVAEDTLTIHYGQRLTLTLLLVPGGRVHLTSGVLPRKALELARDWLAPGLARLSPSLRTGPVLIDPDKVRLPKPSVFGTKQVFTRRTTPGSWQDDPILAATQTALLPEGPSTVQDGYIRVMPGTEGQTSSAYDWPRRGRRGRRDDQTGRRAHNADRGLYKGGELLEPDGGVAAGPPGQDRAAPSASTDLWAPIGPMTVLGGQAVGHPRVTGRVHDVWMEPVHGRRAYAASASGGVWYTDDGGATWRALGGWRAADPMAPKQGTSPLATGCLWVDFGKTAGLDDPTADDVWVGTGEPEADLTGLPGDFLAGIGVLHATAPWSKPETDPVFTVEATNLAGEGIYRLARQPGGTTMVAATTAGLVERPAGGGPQATWPAPAGTPADGGKPLPCTDAVWTPAVAGQPARLWVALRHSTDVMELRWRADGTTTFVAVTLPTGAGATAPEDRLVLAASPTGDTIWALGDGPRLWRIDAKVPNPAGVLVSGVPALWGARSIHTSKMALAVDPSSPENVALGGTVFTSRAALFIGLVTAPAAGTFAYPGAGAFAGDNVHPDVMNIRFTNDGSQVWVACDGGVFVSATAGGNNSYVARNNGLAVVEAGYVASHPTNDVAVVVGAQDNATQRRVSESLWRWEQGGDGGGVAFDQIDTHRYVAQYIRANWSNGPDAPSPPVRRPGQPADAEDTNANFYSTPATIAVGAVNQLAIGTNRVWFTRDWGAHWVTLPDGKIDPRGGAAPNLAQDALPKGSGAIRVLKWGSATRLWVLCRRSLFMMELDAVSGQWTRIPISLEDVLHPAKSTDVAASDACNDIAVQDPIRGTRGSLYLALNGDLSIAEGDQLWWYDGTSSWHKVGLRTQTTGAAFAVAVEPGHEDKVFVGTTLGVFRATLTFNGTAPSWGEWTRLDNGLPDVAVQDLSVFSSGTVRLLRAATQARGVWELDLAGPVTDRTYLRVHPYDSRRVAPSVLAAPFEAKVADPADATKQIPVDFSWHSSPDLRVHPKLGAMAPPSSLPWSLAKPAGTPADPMGFWKLWRFQAALRNVDLRSEPTGTWDAEFDGVLQGNAAPVDAAGKTIINAAFWQSIVTGANAARLPWDTPVPTEADLAEYLPAETAPFGTDRPSVVVPKGRLTAYVMLHHRGAAAAPSAGVQATLLYRTVPHWQGKKSVDWLTDPVGWAAAVTALLTNGTAPSLGVVWKLAQPGAGARQSPAADVAAAMPSVATFEVDLSGAEIKDKTLVVLVAVVHSAADPVALTDVPLRQLVLSSPYVAVRSVAIKA